MTCPYCHDVGGFSLHSGLRVRCPHCIGRPPQTDPERAWERLLVMMLGALFILLAVTLASIAGN